MYDFNVNFDNVGELIFDTGSTVIGIAVFCFLMKIWPTAKKFLTDPLLKETPNADTVVIPPVK